MQYEWNEKERRARHTHTEKENEKSKKKQNKIHSQQKTVTTIIFDNRSYASVDFKSSFNQVGTQFLLFCTMALQQRKMIQILHFVNPHLFFYKFRDDGKFNCCLIHFFH